MNCYILSTRTVEIQDPFSILMSKSIKIVTKKIIKIFYISFLGISLV